MKMAVNVTSTHPLEAADDPDKDEYFYSIKKRIYQSAKEGFSLNLCVLLSRVESAEVRSVLVNQASEFSFVNFPSFFVHVRMENFLPKASSSFGRAISLFWEIFCLIFSVDSHTRLTQFPSLSRMSMGFLCF
jgi:hypothetical protein